ALSYHYLLPRSTQLVKAVGHIKDNFLMRAVETYIRHHQFLPRCSPGRIAPAEVEQQPLRGQLTPSQQRVCGQGTAADNLDIWQVPIGWRRLRRNRQRWEWNEGPILSTGWSRPNRRLIGT